MANPASPLPTDVTLSGVDSSNKDKEVQVGALRIGTTLLGDVVTINERIAADAIVETVSVDADELAIPVTYRFVSKTTGADAEALTLANGVPGQELTVSLVTDGGGDGTLTPTTATGFVAIVFADAGDTANLKYIDDTVGWIIVGTHGATAPPAVSLS